MKIQIDDHRKVFAIQEEFNKLFTHLKIEFLSKPSKAGGASSKKIIKNSKTLGQCRAVHTKGELTLTPSMTVADLKQTLSDTYGLSIRIFRRSGTEWIETTGNDDFRLLEQSAENQAANQKT